MTLYTFHIYYKMFSIWILDSSIAKRKSEGPWRMNPGNIMWHSWAGEKWGHKEIKSFASRRELEAGNCGLPDDHLGSNVSRYKPSQIAVLLAELLSVTEAELQIENFSVSPLISKMMPPPSRKYTIHGSLEPCHCSVTPSVRLSSTWVARPHAADLRSCPCRGRNGYGFYMPFLVYRLL